MKKIISLFQRNYDGDRLVRDEVVSGAEWVIHGEGIATEKIDGTCCMVRDSKLYKRYDAKAFTVDKETGKHNEWNRKPPDGFEPAQDPDPETGHWPGWLLVDDGNNDKWHREAFQHYNGDLPDGTYELVGPKVQGNPYKYDRHRLIKHGLYVMDDCPRDYEGLKQYLKDKTIEGIVWHHPDGRMVKIKRKDFWK